MRFAVPITLAAAVAPAFAIHVPRGAAGLMKRADVCEDLRISSNNGDRKVAIVIDSSGSMSSNDPRDRRADAGRALNDFLISDAEAASTGKTADKIAVIDFDDVATLLYPLGDPGGANASFSRIDSFGGTFIAAGVNMAIDQLTAPGTGATDQRSAIVVFTDGEDSSTSTLVAAIGKAKAAGIRVSFGFLDPSASNQDTQILKAVRETRGAYATITTASGSQNYINYVLNGLTYNDNPQGFDSQLLAGLSQTYTISGSNTVTLRYSAQQGERITFRVVGFAAGTLSSVAQMGGSSLNTPVTSSGFSGGTVSVTAPSTGLVELQVTARSAGQDAQFSVSTNSNVPLKNCTVAVGGIAESGGLSTGAKAGIGVGATLAALAVLGGGGYFAFKHFHTGGGGISPPAGDGGISSAPGATNTTGFAPATPGQGGVGMPAPAPPGAGGIGAGGGAGGFGGGGQMPLGVPPPGAIAAPPMPPPMSGGGPGVFVPVFIPPVIPGTPGSQNNQPRNSSPSTVSADPSSPFGPGQSPYLPLHPTSGYPFGQAPMHPDGLQHHFPGGNQPPQELGGNHGGMTTPANQGGLTHAHEMMTPEHTGTPFTPSSGGDTAPLPPGGHGGLGPYGHSGSAFTPSSGGDTAHLPGGHGGLDPHGHTGSPFAPSSGGDVGHLPGGHGDLGPRNHTGFGPPGAPEQGSLDPTGSGMAGPHGGGGPQQVYVPSSGVGFSDPEKRRHRHHHHPWLDGMPCEDRSCFLHQDSHVCNDSCPCMCVDSDCPINQ